MRVLVRELGHPERRYPCIHIAGSNGKGSTAAMIAAVLTASGYKTGLYTSPHLVSFNERIRIDGEKISNEAIVTYTALLKSFIINTRATFFEATTAMALLYFAEQNVDIAVIETGLGGRYDATNIITPLLSIITSISLEHTAHLGKTVRSIAYQKGGIIKPHIPCLSGVDENDAVAVLKTIAKENHSPFFQSRKNGQIRLAKNSLHGIVVDIDTKLKRYHGLALSLCGEYQTNNLLVSLQALEYLEEKCGFNKISDRTLRDGLKNVQKYSGLRGRMDVLQQKPLLIADAAHNPQGIQRLVTSMKSLFVGKVLLICGVMADKEYKTMIHLLKPIVRLAITTSPRIQRALPASELTSEFRNEGVPSLTSRTVKEAYRIAREEVRRNEPVLVTGSQYLLGELMEQLEIVP
jgi:dihydrofolate synthase/folylpolyglutamate synthase